MVYESAIPLDELSSPGQYMMAQDAPNSYGGGKTNPGGSRWPKIPKFMSALSPSKVKISDLLRPLLRKVRPGQLPPSPGHQLHGVSAAPGHGGSKGSSAPIIPGGAPYSNTGHRPENLDVIHLIAGPQANSYQPAVIHVSQLVRHKNRGSGGKMKYKKMRNKKKSTLNKPGFNPYPGFEGAASPPMPSGHSSSYQSSPFSGNGNPFSQGLNPYPSGGPGGMRPSGPSYGQQHSSGIKGGGGMTSMYQVVNGNQEESYEINHGSAQSNNGNNYNTQQGQVMTGYSGPSTGNNNYEEMISISLPPNPPASYGQAYSELSHMPPAPFQHVNQRPHQPSPHHSSPSQSYGGPSPPSGNQNEYIEVINLPPRGAQSVEYNPGSSPSGNYNSASSGNNHNSGSSGSYNSASSGNNHNSGTSGNYNPGSSGNSYNSGSSPSGNYNSGSSPSGNYNSGSSGNNYNSGHNGNHQSANSYLDPQSQGQSGGYSGNQGVGYSGNQGGGYSGNQGGGYSGNQGGGYSGNQGGGQSYSAASSLPSYGDQSSNNNNPSYEASNHNSGPSSSPSSYSGGNGAAGATIELIDGSTSPNFNYKSVTSLDPKELVELIAKQVPALKDVLTPGHSNDDQGSSNSGYSNGNQGSQNSGYEGSQNSGNEGPQNSGNQGPQNSGNQGSQSGGQDVSYEVIQMPPIYHNKEGVPPPSHQEPSYSPAVNYAGGKGEESGESSYEGGGQSGTSGGNNYPLSNGYTQESSYSPSSQSSQSSSEQSPYQPPYESPSTYDQQSMKSTAVQYSNIPLSHKGYDSNNNNYLNNYENNNNQYLSDESQRSNVIASQGSSSVQLPSSSSHSSSSPSSSSSHSSPSSSYKFGQRLASSTSELSSSLSSSSGEESSSQHPSSASSGSSSSSSSQSGSDSVLSQLYANGEDGGRVKVSPVKVLTKGSEDDEFKEDSNLAGILLSESALPSSLPSSSSTNSQPETQSEDYVAKSRK